MHGFRKAMLQPCTSLLLMHAFLADVQVPGIPMLHDRGCHDGNGMGHTPCVQWHRVSSGTGFWCFVVPDPVSGTDEGMLGAWALGRIKPRTRLALYWATQDSALYSRQLQRPDRFWRSDLISDHQAVYPVCSRDARSAVTRGLPGHLSSLHLCIAGEVLLNTSSHIKKMLCLTKPGDWMSCRQSISLMK